jgi:ATP-dependent DNA ligase
MVWDHGFWDCEDPARGFSKGKLDFNLEGEKLRGGWILTRLRQREGENRTNWLLLKHLDAFAQEGKNNRILDEDMSVASGRLLPGTRQRNLRRESQQGRRMRRASSLAIEVCSVHRAAAVHIGRAAP